MGRVRVVVGSLVRGHLPGHAERGGGLHRRGGEHPAGACGHDPGLGGAPGPGIDEHARLVEQEPRETPLGAALQEVLVACLARAPSDVSGPRLRSAMARRAEVLAGEGGAYTLNRRSGFAASWMMGAC